ncbi:MAG: hypothetical protein ACKN83_09175 [Vulcanococcus sp.]
MPLPFTRTAAPIRTLAAATGLLLAATNLLTARAPAAPAPPASDLELRRSQLRTLGQQQQQRLEQRLRCINRAGSLTELEGCERSRYGPAMGGAGCPMW